MFDPNEDAARILGNYLRSDELYKRAIAERNPVMYNQAVAQALNMVNDYMSSRGFGPQHWDAHSTFKRATGADLAGAFSHGDPQRLAESSLRGQGFANPLDQVMASAGYEKPSYMAGTGQALAGGLRDMGEGIMGLGGAISRRLSSMLPPRPAGPYIDREMTELKAPKGPSPFWNNLGR